MGRRLLAIDLHPATGPLYTSTLADSLQSTVLAVLLVGRKVNGAAADSEDARVPLVGGRTPAQSHQHHPSSSSSRSKRGPCVAET